MLREGINEEGEKDVCGALNEELGGIEKSLEKKNSIELKA